jgi:aminoglycoside 3-N-acetyltransferase
MIGITKNAIFNGFRQLGLQDGDIVLVHSSLRSFGYVENGVATVITALLDAVGEWGTVMVPTLTGNEKYGKDNPPVFDVNITPCWTGKIPETFRLLPQAERSLHPTHSVAAIGHKKHELLSEHQYSDSPCDKKSPYYKNAVNKGYVMLIGVGQESNTTIHCCEEIAGVPYHLQKDYTDTCITGYHGEKIHIRNKLHSYFHPPTEFNKFNELFTAHGIMRMITIGNSTIKLIKAADMIDLAVNLLQRDPLFLLKEE